MQTNYAKIKMVTFNYIPGIFMKYHEIFKMPTNYHSS